MDFNHVNDDRKEHIKNETRERLVPPPETNLSQQPGGGKCGRGREVSTLGEGPGGQVGASLLSEKPVIRLISQRNPSTGGGSVDPEDVFAKCTVIVIEKHLNLRKRGKSSGWKSICRQKGGWCSEGMADTRTTGELRRRAKIRRGL